MRRFHLNSNFVLFSFFIVLIATKIIHFYDFRINDFYIDIDRLTSLSLFVLYWHYFRKISYKDILYLISFLLTSIVTGLALGLSPILVIITFILTALVEEIIFRGYVLLFITRKLGDIAGATISSLIYTLVHIPFKSDIAYLMVVFVLGLLLSAIILTGNRNLLCMPRKIILTTFIHELIIIYGFYAHEI